MFICIDVGVVLVFVRTVGVMLIDVACKLYTLSLFWKFMLLPSTLVIVTVVVAAVAAIVVLFVATAILI